MSYKIYKEFPVLYGIEKSGKTKMWRASVYYEDNEDNKYNENNKKSRAMSSIEFGQIEGKKQLATKEYTEGKNIGKKNETTALQQCVNETMKKWSDKKEKEDYKESISERQASFPRVQGKEVLDGDEKNEENKENKYFPMLAHTYEPNSSKNKKNDIIFPCYVQPKLDGLRCIMYKDGKGVIRCQSRTGTYFDTMDHIVKELYDLFSNPIILDGELYTDNMPFEELSGLIKKKKISENDKERLKNVKYHIYDIVDNTKIYKERYQNIIDLIGLKYEYSVTVPAYFCNKDHFKEFFGNFIEKGYEGIMLRNINGMYVCNYRSHDLQKYKEFMESEYEIVGFKQGDGRDKGTVIWVCKTDNKEFSVRPKGTIDTREELFINAKSYIGKKLTVIYQELSEMGVPRFPVGKAIRDDY